MTAQPAPIDLDLRDLVMTLWRRRFLIVGVVAVALAAMSVFVALVPPLYAGRALVMIENPGMVAAEGKAVAPSARLDHALVFSEVEVLKSRALASRVIDRLDLANDPAFNPRLRGAASFFSVWHAPEAPSAFKSFSVHDRQSADFPPDVLDQARGQVVDEFLKHLSVRAVPGSFVIQVEFAARDPGRAALIANTLVDNYIEQRLEGKFAAAQKMQQWLDKRLASLRTDAREAEEKAEQYRAAHNLIVGARADVTAQQLSELNSRLVAAKAQLADAQGRLDGLRSPAGAAMQSAPAVMDSRVVQDLKIEEAALLRTLSDMKSRYGEKHPAIIKTRAELADLRAKMSGETRMIAQAMENEKAIAAAQVAQLEAALAMIERTQQGENRAGIEWRALTQEAESSRSIYETFLQNQKRADQQELLQEADARILSYAIVPSLPAFPNKPLFFSLTLIGALFAGVSLALLREKLDGTVHNGTMLEMLTGYPAYGMVPLADEKLKGIPANYVTDQPESPAAEAIRTLRMAITLRNSAQTPQVVTVTSSLPGEGKTTLCSWMAQLASRAGERVVLIDADMRRPNVHKTFGRTPEKTLEAYLSGRAALEDVIARPDGGAPHLIMAGSVPAEALHLLSSERMRALITALREKYDLILIDSPACLAVSDARLLAHLADLTLYAVAWEDTPRDMVAAGVKQFTDLHYGPLALVLTRVDLKRHARYGYGPAWHYYGKYRPAPAD